MASATVFTQVVAALPACSGPDGAIQTVPFLAASRLVLPVIGALA